MACPCCLPTASRPHDSSSKCIGKLCSCHSYSFAVLVTVHAAGLRYIIGLPLLPTNSIQTAKAMMATAAQALPAGSVLGYEIGQEPEFW